MAAAASALAAPALGAEKDAAQARALIISMSYAGADDLYLANTTNDALLIERTVRRLGVASVDVVRDADEATFRHGLASFVRRVKMDDLAIIYLAGHGVQVDAENYLLLNDGKTFISMNSILDMMRLAAGTVVLLLDACRNNPFDQAPEGSRGVRIARPDARALSDATDAGFVFKPLAEKVAIGRVGAFSVAGTGVRVVFATDPQNVALDYANAFDQNSPFATAIAIRLLERRSLDDAITLATGDVVKATRGAQSPWSQGSIGRPIYLAGQPKQRNPAKPPFQVPG